jgi:signal recognition particle receptor subunit beta
VPVINHAKKEIHAKIVYVGPPGAGKRTCVTLIHSRLRPECRSDLKVMGEVGKGVLYFSFLPHELESVEGYRVRFHLYALDAVEAHEETIRMVLKGADGIMFVADGSPDRQEDNGSSLELLGGILALGGVGFRDLPVLAQINRKDLLPQSGGDEFVEVLTGRGVGAVFSDALKGEGVLEAVARLVKGIMQNLRQGGVLLSEFRLPPGEEADQVREPRVLSTEPSRPTPHEPAPGEASADHEGAGWALEGAGELRMAEGNVLSIPLELAGPGGQRCHLTLSLALTVQEK